MPCRMLQSTDTPNQFLQRSEIPRDMCSLTCNQPIDSWQSSTNLSVISHNELDSEHESVSKTTNMKGKRVTKNLTQNNLKKRKSKRTKGLSRSMDEEVLREALGNKEDDLSSED